MSQWVFDILGGKFQLYSSMSKLCTNENMDALRKTHEWKFFVILWRKKGQNKTIIKYTKECNNEVKDSLDILSHESREII